MRPGPPPQPPAPMGAAKNKRARACAPARCTDRTQRSLVSTNRSDMGGHAPHGQHNASDGRFVACPGKAEGRNEAEQPPALQAPPRPHNWGVRRTPPPPQPAPQHMNATDPPRGAQPPQGVPVEGTEQGPHTRTPAPTTRGSRTPTARPVGGQSGEGERMTPDAPRNGRRHPPRGRTAASPTTPSQVAMGLQGSNILYCNYLQNARYFGNAKIPKMQRCNGLEQDLTPCSSTITKSVERSLNHCSKGPCAEIIVIQRDNQK